MPAPALSDHVIAQLPPGPVCVGLSGGMDSVVLLHLLAVAAQVRERGLRAVHVHHGVHPDADDWARRCTALCARLDVRLAVRRVRVVHNGSGLEGALRDARYAVFDSELRPGECLALAHHLDDQAETFLLRALRASGVDGLAAIPAMRLLGDAPVVRPLLDIPRSQLHAYALRHHLEWIDDPGNADLSMDRNFLRHRLMPLLQERWPHAAASFARSAALCRQDSDLLLEEDARTLAAARTLDAQVLRVDALQDLAPARRSRVLRLWLRQLKLQPLPAHLAMAAGTQLLEARADAAPRVAWSGTELRRWRDLLYAGRARASLPLDWRVRWDGRDALALPDGGQLRLLGDVLLPDRCIVHARAGGERIVLPGRGHSHALKHVLQDLGVPPWLRERLPLLSTDEGELLAAGDLVVSHRLDTWLRDHRTRLHWQPPSDAVD
ncbi:tRNA lysidine(34) synthetase TilS [Lysobacter korlensis]|uniref:tRNA(Ile)-lysidine synthase n=1 Tax=Lysobacter korlensis TaxID=553636 RepID=A0ABV6RRF3_9GAMM